MVQVEWVAWAEQHTDEWWINKETRQHTTTGKRHQQQQHLHTAVNGNEVKSQMSDGRGMAIRVDVCFKGDDKETLVSVEMPINANASTVELLKLNSNRFARWPTPRSSTSLEHTQNAGFGELTKHAVKLAWMLMREIYLIKRPSHTLSEKPLSRFSVRERSCVRDIIPTMEQAATINISIVLTVNSQQWHIIPYRIPGVCCCEFSYDSPVFSFARITSQSEASPENLKWKLFGSFENCREYSR